MLFNFTISSVILFLVGFIALILSSVIWTRRRTPGAVPFLFFLLAMIWWLFARILQSAAVNYDDKVIMAIITYAGIAGTAIFWTCFAMEYSGVKWWKMSLYLPLLFVIPVLAILFVVFSLYFNLGWFNISLLEDQTGFFVVWSHSSIFWIQITYLTLLVLWGITMLGRFMLRRSGNYRRQFFIILIGTLIPGISMFGYTLRYLPTEPVDWLPLSFMLGGLIYAVTIFRFKFLDVVTVARGELVESLPDGILVLNSEGRIADLNPAAEKIIGTDKPAVMGKLLDSVWPNLDPLVAGPNTGQGTELVTEGNGKPRYLDISVTPVKGVKGKVEGHLVVMRDITERRKIEQALMESESRYETLIEQSNEGVLIIQDGVYKFANRTMTEITGYSVKELVGKLIPFTIAEDDRKMLEERYRLKQSGQALPVVYDINLIRKDGEKRDSEISIGTIVYEAYLAEMLTVRDVTERKLTQRKLEELFNQEKQLSTSLQEEIEKRRKYTRALVHELKTPLTAILASGELLEDEVKDSILMSLVKNIRQSSLNMEQRINELIELARGETGLLKIDAEPMNLGELLKEIVAEISPDASAKGLTMVSEIGNLPKIMGDKTRLRQVISNLLSNAVKFTNSGTVSVIAAREGDKKLLVQVKDTGRGMNKEQMQDLFDPYRKRVNEGQVLGGLGIGLALTRMFVELHGGEVRVESQLGTGTVFSFTIPVSELPDPHTLS